MRRGVIIGLSVLMAVTGTTVTAQPTEPTAGQQLYEQECGACHGKIASEAHQHVPELVPWNLARLAMALPAGSTGRDVAVALPYGPPLRGMFGQTAGTVAGFAYSRAFLEVLHGMVWERSTLDVWLTDSQAWVPGSRMFYAQPDAEIRRAIITYLEANR